MQLTLSPEQQHLVENVLHYTLFPALGWFVKSIVNNLRSNVNRLITDNVNRISEDITKHVDLKFIEHEDNAFVRITALEKSVTEMGKILEEIKAAQVKSRGAAGGL